MMWKHREEELKQTVQFIHENKRFLICSHVNPDADALGSTLALGFVLKELGKDVTMYNEGETPYNLVFLPGVDQVLSNLPENMEPVDGTIIVDCGSIKRVGKSLIPFYQSHKAGTLVCIDHHISNDGFGGIDLVAPEFSSTGEIVAAVIQAFRHPFSENVATCLLAAISVDTGSFKYQSTSAYTFRLCSQLVDAGASPHKVAQELYERRPRHYFHLFRDILETLQFHEKLPVAWMRVDHSTLDRYGYDIDVTEGMVEEIRFLDDCEVAIFYKENKYSNGYKVSMRSKEVFDVAAVCAQYGGGGHHRAAGVDIKGSFEDVHMKIIHEIEKQMPN